MKYILCKEMLDHFQRGMAEEEKSSATIEKYMRDVRNFYLYAEKAGGVSKEVVLAYKNNLSETYAITSANSMLAAVNVFLKFMGWNECTVKAFRIQKEPFRSRDRELTKEEYYRLLHAAKSKGSRRLYLLMQTICSTGIRVSELKFITVQAVYDGQVKVSLKGKTRTVLLPVSLCRELKVYIRSQKLRSGTVFISRNGNPLDRSNILHDMKNLCDEAGVERRKVFPHNLRHLFACCYYKIEKDISHLADLLGHSNINTTRIYTQVSSVEQMRKIELLGLVV